MFKLESVIASRRELVLYCIIGCSGVAIDYAAFALLTKILGLHYQIANAISVSLGICNNFFWNAYLNFKIKDRIVLRFCSFYCVGMIGLGISAGLLYVFVERIGANVLISKLTIILIVTVVQFLFNKFVTFKKRECVVEAQKGAF